MLLLQRHTNESVVIQDKDDPSKTCIVRLVDVFPTGDATLGFIGDNFKIVRNEILGKKSKGKDKSSGKSNNSFYS